MEFDLLQAKTSQKTTFYKLKNWNHELYILHDKNVKYRAGFPDRNSERARSNVLPLFAGTSHRVSPMAQ